MAQTSGFDPSTQVKTCFDCKMFDVANWVACLNGENGPGGTPSHQFHLKEHWRFLQSLDTLLPWTETISAHLDWWQNPTNVMKGSDLHPKDHSIQLFADASDEGWGACLEQTSAKGLWSDREKRLHINVLELTVVSLALQRFKDHGSPSQGDPKSQAIQLPDHRNSPRLARDALVLGPSAAFNRDPTATSSVKNSSQTVPQLCVPQQSTASQPPRLVSRSGQLQEQSFSVEVAERITAPQRLSTRTIYKSKSALFEKWCRQNLVDFSTPSVKQVSDFFMYLYQDLNGAHRPLMVIGWPLLTLWAQQGSISLKV